MAPEVIEMRLRQLGQLFNSLDPSPFHEKDLDTAAREYVLGRALDMERGRPWELHIHLDPNQPPSLTEEVVGEAVRADFALQVDHAVLELRQLLRRGRLSLAIGLTFLGACLVAAKALNASDSGPMTELFESSLVIGGWVAMWRPIEIFLYEWWPLASRIRLLRRLARLEVRLRP